MLLPLIEFLLVLLAYRSVLNSTLALTPIPTQSLPLTLALTLTLTLTLSLAHLPVPVAHVLALVERRPVRLHEVAVGPVRVREGGGELVSLLCTQGAKEGHLRTWLGLGLGLGVRARVRVRVRG